MKKAIIVIVTVFAVLFSLVSVAVPRYKAELYSLMYPQNVAVEKGESVEKIELKQGDYFILGSCYSEPIMWQIIDGENGLLAWSEYILCFRAYDDTSSEWHGSDLKQWLNGKDEFFSSENFSDAEKSVIADNRDGEKIFILSKAQLQKISEEKRAKAPTVSAVRSYGSDRLILRRNSWYWTSSPVSTNTSSVTAVTQGGGFYKSLASDELTGVCPAFILKDSAVSVCGGNGTKEKPYVLDFEGEAK